MKTIFMRPFKKTAITTALLASSFLAACSDGGSVTTLDARPSVSVSIPAELQNDSSVIQENLSPQIRLSNGAAVNLVKNTDGTWAGTINVAPGRTYIVTIIWVETIDGQDIPLASQTQTLEVTAEGAVTRTDSNGYSTDIDSDSDGSSNLSERGRGTDPLQADSSSSVTVPNDDGAEATPGTTPDTTPVTTSDPVPDTTAGTTTDPTSETTPDSPTDTPSETTPDSTPDPAIADVIVPRVASSSVPIIDGSGVSTLGLNGELTGEWAAAVQLDNSGASLLVDELRSGQDSDENTGSPRRTWAAMHDGLYLYILVLVDDAGDRYRDSGSAISEDDSVEIFLDGDNSKSQSYDDNDFNQLFPLQLPGDDAQSTTVNVVGSTLTTAPLLSIRSATGPGNGPARLTSPESRQDVYEIRIGLASAGVNIDEPLGFEIIVNDDDGGGESNAQWSWKLPAESTGELHQNPSLFGTLVLE